VGVGIFALSGIQDLNHTSFSIKRLKFIFPNALVVGAENG
jgi:hypothetical protein